ncbi:heterokaryon incompatibility protein-domain-containing protein [Apodospora peruviana]|uniref:Heterokaryon incompatibility protein-domain-containing protein n=1 Tax=Apodospora peruviana TaxID=516989 RepID=A0AAE0HX44_9PEZI|nr:heterokaryon incompatibility protein-domain-containing protein [Apodospora peruviana]
MQANSICFWPRHFRQQISVAVISGEALPLPKLLTCDHRIRSLSRPSTSLKPLNLYGNNPTTTKVMSTNTPPSPPSSANDATTKSAITTTSQLHDFQYDPFPDPAWIRLLKIVDTSGPSVHVTLETFPMASAPPYTALSYTWGSAYPGDNMTSDRTTIIICNGKRVLVNQNLSLALQSKALRNKVDHHHLWADAICLNQGDLSERAVQVARMDQVYAQAKSVLVWLGPADESAVVAFPLIEDLAPRLQRAPAVATQRYPPQSACSASYESLSPLKWHYTHPLLWSVLGRSPLLKSEEMALADLFSRHWFERAWVIQEIVLAQGDVVVVCGDDLCLEWTSLVTVCGWMMDGGLAHRYNTRVGETVDLPPLGLGTAPVLMEQQKKATRKALTPLISMLRVAADSRPLTAGKGQQIDKLFFSILLVIINKVRMYCATDGRDKIYVPMALVMHTIGPILPPDSDARQLLPDYTVPDSETFIKASRLIVKHTKSLAILMEIEVPFLRTRTDLPSWVPDFGQGKVWPLCHDHAPDKKEDGCMFGSGHTSCDATVASGRVLKCKGTRVDIVDIAGYSSLLLEEEKSSPPSSCLLGLRLLRSMQEPYIDGCSSVVKAYLCTVLGGGGGSSVRLNEADSKLYTLLLYNFGGCHEFRDLMCSYMDDTGIQNEQTAIESLATLLKINPNSDSLSNRLWWVVLVDELAARHPHAVPTFADLVAWMALRGGYAPSTAAYMGPSNVTSEFEYDREKPPPAFLESADFLPKFFAKLPDYQYEELERWHSLAFSSHSPFKSETGYIGLMPLGARHGDEVWLLEGCPVPIMLRKTSTSGEYTVVGKAYVHGVMDGEYWTQPRGELEGISLV